MADILCAHCSEPWDVYGLRHEGVGYLDDSQAEVLRPLGAEVVAAFRSFWTTVDVPNEAESARYAGTVNTALYRAVLSGRGCPSCGFAHPGTGAHRAAQLAALVFDGVTDDDPLEFI